MAVREPVRGDVHVVPLDQCQSIMYRPMIMKTRMRISKGGQISIPASVRRRWATSTLTLDDQGERLVLQPAPDDPIAAAEGALAKDLGSHDLARLRRSARNDDQGRQERSAR